MKICPGNAHVCMDGCMYLFVCMYGFMYVCSYIGMYVCTYVIKITDVRMYVCMYVSMYVYTHIYNATHVQTGSAEILTFCWLFKAKPDGSCERIRAHTTHVPSTDL